jgi:hypothetical protein
MTFQRFIFSKNRKTRILRHLSAWGLLYVFAILTYPPKGSGTSHGFQLDGFLIFYRMVLIRVFLMLLCQMVFCYLFLYILVPFYFRKKRYLQFALLLFVTWLVTATFRFTIYLFVYNPVMEYFHYHTNDLHTILLFSMRQTISGPAFIGGVFIAAKLYKDWQQKQQDNIALLKENANAEIQLLKAQVHPHFLFNTLNNIYSFTINHSPVAGELVRQLYGLMYYMMHECNEPYVPLEKEISILRSYTDLEKVRYGNRLTLELDISGKWNDKEIAPLLMIPFLENSFKHGTSRTLDNPWIRLSLFVTENRLFFNLANGKPYGDEAPKLKKGIGLANVTKRLQLIYGTDHVLQVDNMPDQFSVYLEVPVRKI